MFKINPTFFILLLYNILLFTNCHKHDCDNDKPRQVFIPQEVLDFVDFKAGTYWIYQDSATGRIDSEVVESSRHLMQDVTELNDCGKFVVMRQYENIEMIIQRYDSVGNKTLSWIRDFNNAPKINNPKEDNIFAIDNYNSFTIGYPFNLIYNNHGYDVHESLADSIIYNGVTYYGILKLDEQFENQNDFIIAAFAKKIGRLFIGTTGGQQNQFQKANLIRYKIK
jgi:hypothetical protein